MHRLGRRPRQCLIPLANMIGRHVANPRTQRPDPRQMLVGGLGPRCRPFDIPLGRAVGHHKPPRRIRTKGRDDVHRVHHVLLGFGHLGTRDHLDQQTLIIQRLNQRIHIAHILGVNRRGIAQHHDPPVGDGYGRHILGQVIHRSAIGIPRQINLMRHHALGEEGVERLNRLGRQMPRRVHRPRKEAAVKQMQNRVFNPADILIDVHPVIGLGQIGRRLGMRRGKAGVIPGRIHKRVHRIRLAPRRCPALRARTVPPRRMAVQGVARNVKRHIIGQFNRQVFLLLGHHTAGIAMHHRNGAAPIALPRNPPVAQAVVGHTPANPLGLAIGNRRRHRRLTRLLGLTGKAPDIAHLFRLHRHIGLGQLLGFAHKHRHNRQTVLGRKVKIPPIMCRATKDRARSVIHQDEVRDVNRQLPRGVHRMHNPHPGIHPQLFRRLQRLGRGASFATLGHKGRNRGVRGLQRLGQGVIRADGGKRRPQQSIRPCRVNLQPLKTRRGARRRKAKLQALRPSNPVGLHHPHLFGPILQPVQGGQQLGRIVGNLEEPLRQFPPLNRRIRPPALAVNHLLIGQNGHVDRVPVHHRRLAIDQTGPHHVDEHRLLLAIVFRITGRKLAAPVNRQAQRLHLRPHVRNVAIGPVLGVPPPLHRRILGGHPERIPPHRMQNREPLRRLVPRHHIAHRIVAHMAHVDAPRRIGEHLQHIVLGSRRVVPCGEHPGAGPGLLPLRFDYRRFIARHVRGPFANLTRNYTACGVKVQPCRTPAPDFPACNSL